LHADGQGSTFVELSTHALASTLVPLPPPAAQRAVADFLDAETSRIDALIVKKRRMAALLSERKEAEIDKLVWTSTDTGSRWPAIPYRRIAHRVDVGIAEAATQAYAEDGVPLIRSTNIRPNHLDTSDILHIEPAFAYKHRSKTVHAGDILTIRTGNAGVSAEVPAELDGCQTFTQLISTVREPNNGTFYSFALNSSATRRYFDELQWGSAQDNISVPILAAAPVPMAGPAAQEAAVRALRQFGDRYNGTTERLHRQVRLLQERRAALITAAVTGQLETSGVAA